jgi:pSer/pThr/pTyr-binding forkhead associated (FHA) protein
MARQEESKMAKLTLMFEDKLVKQVPIGSRPVGIGRSPDNDLPVDNLAVSNYHARVYVEAGRLVVEDLDSLNGTFVNDLRVERATLHDGDSIWVGKHHIKVDASVTRHRWETPGRRGPSRRASTKRWCWTPKPDATCCSRPPRWVNARSLRRAA